jgi:hypothetical protein
MITVKYVRIKVDPVWPCDCARNGIDRDLRKVGRFPELVEETLAEDIPKVELPDDTVSEGQPKTEVS